MSDSTVWKAVKPFVNGGVSGMMATCVIQPIDMVKVRLQLGATGSPLSVAGQIIKNDGVGGLYRGLSAGLLRQATYTTARLGFYNVISEEAIKMNDGQASESCCLASSFLPLRCTMLCRLRSQAANPLPVPVKYAESPSPGKGCLRIIKEEGVGGLFAGCGPTVARAMALNCGMLASNDQ
eukprot:scaffold127225_cov43-Prasinocladus_malaysianus.AAC.1